MEDSWNPEPPPEIASIKKDDLIEGTLFSKHAVFELLLKLINKLNGSSDTDADNLIDIDIDDHDDTDNDEINTKDARKYRELDDELEKDLCDLWDMTVEKSVCHFLDEYNGMQIFEGFLRKYNEMYPRAVEILVGILVNMATLSGEIALKIAGNASLVNFLLIEIFAKMTDVQSMIQTVGLFNVVLGDLSDERSVREAAKVKFVQHLKNLPAEGDQDVVVVVVYLEWERVLEKMHFILQQSLNTSLLDNTCSLLLNFLYTSDEILQIIAQNANTPVAICDAALTRVQLDQASKHYTQAGYSTTRDDHPSSSTTNATKTPCNNNNNKHLTSQLSSEDISSVDRLFNKYFLCLQTLSTCEAGVVSLNACEEHVTRLLDAYLDRILVNFDTWEVQRGERGALKGDLGAESVQNVACLMSTLSSVLPENDLMTVVGQRRSGFFVKLLTFALFYLNFFIEYKRSPPKYEDETDFVKELESFDLAKSAVQDVLDSVVLLRSEESPTLTKLIDDCVNLIKLC